MCLNSYLYKILYLQVYFWHFAFWKKHEENSTSLAEVLRLWLFSWVCKVRHLQKWHNLTENNLFGSKAGYWWHGLAICLNHSNLEAEIWLLTIWNHQGYVKVQSPSPSPSSYKSNFKFAQNTFKENESLPIQFKLNRQEFCWNTGFRWLVRFFSLDLHCSVNKYVFGRLSKYLIN